MKNSNKKNASVIIRMTALVLALAALLFTAGCGAAEGRAGYGTAEGAGDGVIYVLDNNEHFMEQKFIVSEDGGESFYEVSSAQVLPELADILPGGGDGERYIWSNMYVLAKTADGNGIVVGWEQDECFLMVQFTDGLKYHKILYCDRDYPSGE